MNKYDGKVRPLPSDERLQHGDGYRGDYTVQWTLVTFHVGRRSTEMFGTWCVHCLTSWGWTFEAAHARKLHKAMAKLGCPRCPKTSTKAKKD